MTASLTWVLFWLVAALMTLGLTAYATRPLWRGRDAAPSRAAHDVTVYKSQLAEIERDHARGALSVEEAEGARREIARRLLAADAEAQGAAAIPTAPTPVARAALIAAAAPIAVGGAVVYLLIGSPGSDGRPLAERSFQAELEAFAEARRAQAPAGPEAPPAPSDDPNDPANLLPQLEAAVANRPDDPRGHELLGNIYASEERFAEAWRAYERAIALGGASRTALDLIPAQGELMVLAAGGVVSPEAEAVFRRTAQAPRSRYYLGLAEVQRGQARAGIRRWTALLADTPPGPLADALRVQIASAAAQAGLARGAAEGGDRPEGAVPALSEEQRAAVLAMSPEEQRAFMEDRINDLAARLESAPASLDEWLMLIRSRRQIGDDEGGAAAAERAREVFADNAGAVARINRAASEPLPRLLPEPDAE